MVLTVPRLLGKIIERREHERWVRWCRSRGSLCDECSGMPAGLTAAPARSPGFTSQPAAEFQTARSRKLAAVGEEPKRWRSPKPQEIYPTQPGDEETATQRGEVIYTESFSRGSKDKKPDLDSPRTDFLQLEGTSHGFQACEGLFILALLSISNH
ncbi:hypothetical protein CapIbe_000549 [Capra ibex]